MINTCVYYQLSPVLFGNGTIKYAGEKAKGIGISKALVVSDQGVKKAGHLATLEDILRTAGIECVIWSEAQKDCPDETIKIASEIAKNKKVDGVIGLGGGSVLDTAKAVAAVSANDEQVLNDIEKYLMGDKKYEHPPLPLLEIATTSGTGSESTFVSVVSSSKLNCKIGLPVSPDYSIVDPQLTLTVPQYITAFTGMDALAHAVESLTEQKNSPHSDLLAYEAIRLICRYLPKAVNDGNDMEAREYLALASNFAGISFNESGTHIGHSCAHVLGHLYQIDHGVCCAQITPGVIRFTAMTFPEKMKNVGRLFGITFSDLDSPKTIGEKTAEAVLRFGKAIGIKSLKEHGLSKQEVLCVAGEVNADHLCHCFAGNVSLDDIKGILESAYQDGII